MRIQLIMIQVLGQQELEPRLQVLGDQTKTAGQIYSQEKDQMWSPEGQDVLLRGKKERVRFRLRGMDSCLSLA